MAPPQLCLTNFLLLCSNEINGMHTSGTNAILSPVQCIVLPIPAMRIKGSNACAGDEA
jgi:hypothetical protein